MHAARPKALWSLALAGLLSLLAVLLGFGRRSRRRLRAAPPHAIVPAPKPVRLSRATVVATTLLVLAAAAGVALGYRVKQAREMRAAAIALTRGNPDRAPRLMVQYGCGGCHTIPGVQGANGLVGPPLAGIARRVYVAGVVTNEPDNLIHWIVNPREISPRTAMPITGISQDEARDVAAYLYTLR